MTHRECSLGLFLFSLTFIALPACKKEGGKTDRVEANVPEASLPEVNAMLAAADAQDGAPDKVVAKCAGCALSMDGKAEHVLAVGDYDLRFCSAQCRANFAPQAAEKVLALNVPGYKPPGDEEDDGR